MSVVNVQKEHSNQSGSVKQGQAGSTSRDLSFSESYTVLVSDPENDGLLTAVDADGLPTIGTQYRSSNARLINKLPTRISPYLYRVVCEYAGDESPLTRPITHAISFADSTEPVDVDSSGNAIINPNGERYTGLQKEVSDIVLTCTRNESYATMTGHLAYHNVLNSDTFFGYAAKHARCKMSASEVRDGTTYYWTVNYQIQIRIVDDWRLRILVEGHKYYTGRTVNGRREYENFYSDAAKTVIDTKSHPLGATGLRLADEENVANHVWVYKDLYPTAAFSVLALGV